MKFTDFQRKSGQDLTPDAKERESGEKREKSVFRQFSANRRILCLQRNRHKSLVFTVQTKKKRQVCDWTHLPVNFSNGGGEGN